MVKEGLNVGTWLSGDSSGREGLDRMSLEVLNDLDSVIIVVIVIIL